MTNTKQFKNLTLNVNFGAIFYTMHRWSNVVLLTEGMFTTDFMVCGIAPYGNNVVVLSYDEQDAIQEVRVVEYRVLSVDLVSRWCISMVSGTNRLTPNLKKKKFHKMTRDQVLHHVQI